MAADHKKAVGRKIAELREARKWTQPELAEKIPAKEVDAQQVSKWERGVHTPNKHLEALADALGVDQGVILAGQQDEGEPGGDLMEQFDEATPAGTAALHRKLDQLLDQQAELLGAVSEVRDEQVLLRQLQERGGRVAANKRK